ncbi:hypothetical protein [Candidatus Absconditicoccus praedator]|uniref:hypothetical protein n=1 Tax=Candidatus Absconditicoccus praedator TaxID=2735562 RepID=UPI001E31CAB7|nr:hypothetical protein [Candidatus Absconditicoccus praedator]UFX83415.1 hypothetical protein HLG78_04780 [Candidatus Absconditicoccus praedator]
MLDKAKSIGVMYIVVFLFSFGLFMIGFVLGIIDFNHLLNYIFRLFLVLFVFFIIHFMILYILER